MSDVPDEILREILCKLPVKPLLRFRCVSKSWKAFIDSKDFIKMHLDHSVKTNSKHSLILRDSYLHSADYNSLNETNWAIFEELEHPLKTPSIATEILGSCNGLLCLLNSEEDIVLWNPSTRKHKKLPVTEIEFPSTAFTFCEFVVYGFGYDCVGDDYKVVRFVRFYGDRDDEFSSEAKVYSLKSNSWKRVQDFPYFLLYKRGYGKLANGALHWVVSRKPESDTTRLIAAFDLQTEEYRLVPQPEYSDESFHMNVGVMGGLLCVLCNYYMDHVDIWVMKGYGVKESWTNLISIKQSDVRTRGFEVMRPIAYSKCGKRVLLEMDNKLLVWYDLEKKSTDYAMTRFGFDPTNLFFELDMCSESLVQLNGGNYDLGKVSKKEPEQNRRRKKKISEDRDDFLSKGFKLVLQETRN